MAKEQTSKIGTTLRKLRKKSGLSSVDLGKKIGISPKTVYNYETGKAKQIPQWVVERYSEVCKPLIDAQTEGHSKPITDKQSDDLGEPFDAPPESGFVIPVISLVAAGAEETTDQSWSPYGGDEWLSRPYGLKDNKAYGARVIGDSMLPFIRPGMLVIASPNIPVEDITNGSIVVVRTKDMVVKLKSYHRSRDNVILKSYSDMYPDETYTFGDFIFIHKVVWYREPK